MTEGSEKNMNTETTTVVTADMAESITDAARACHQLAGEKGWWPELVELPTMSNEQRVNTIAAKIALIHSEASEALEELRHCESLSDLREVRLEGLKPEGFGVELADVVIRCFDLACATGVDIGALIRDKHNFNANRAHRHGGKTL